MNRHIKKWMCLWIVSSVYMSKFNLANATRAALSEIWFKVNVNHRLEKAVWQRVTGDGWIANGRADGSVLCEWYSSPVSLSVCSTAFYFNPCSGKFWKDNGRVALLFVTSVRYFEFQVHFSWDKVQILSVCVSREFFFIRDRTRNAWTVL